MGGNGSGKAGEGLSDRLVEGTQKFGGGSLMIWGCMMEGPEFAVKTDGRMDGDLFVKILDDDLMANLDYYGKNAGDTSSSRIMTLNTPARWPRNGSKTMDSHSFHGLHSPQT